MLREHDPLSGDPTSGGVVHGDAIAANVMVDGATVTGLIDVEYARLGPPDLELLSPELFGAGYGTAWLREDHPELFDVAHLRERLWLPELCQTLRNIVWWPPGELQPAGAPTHAPLVVLTRLVDAPILSFPS